MPNDKAINSILESEKTDSSVTFGDIAGGIRDSNIAGRDVVVQNITVINSPDISVLLTSEYQSQLEHARDLLNSYRPQEAIEYLEKFRDRIWNIAQPIIKYGILRNLGAARILQGQHQEAAKYFIEALQYHPDDEKALCNVALGYLLVEQFEEANSFAKKALDKNPANCHAYSLLLQSFPNTQDFEDLVTMVPDPFRTKPEVGLALGIIARKRKLPAEAKKWFEVAIQHDTKEQPEPRGELGGVLLELAISSEYCLNGLQLTDEQKSPIQQAIDLFDFALSRTSHAAHWDFRSGWLANRGLAKRFAGDLEGAIQDTEQYLEIHPSSHDFIRRRAMLAYESGDIENAVTLLKSILSVEDPPDIPIVLSTILRSAQRASEAVKVLQEFLTHNPDEQLQKKAQRELLESYLALRDFERAKEISETVRAANPNDVLHLVDAAEIAFALGDYEESLLRVLEAKQYITASSPVQELLELANGFYALKEFEEAARIYKYFVNPALNTPLTFRLLMSYYQGGEKGEALDICQTLRQKYGILEHVADMEASIYEEIGDLPKAKKVAQEYLEQFPEHFGMKLLVAVVNSRTGQFEELDRFLNSASYADVEELPWEFGIRLAKLYQQRSQHRKAIENLYELRKSFPEQGIVNREYVHAFILLKQSEDYEWLLPTKVETGTAVCLQRTSGESEWYFIDDYQKSDILRKEFSPSHLIAQKLSSKEVGDELVLKESAYSEESATITEIKSKYVYVLHEILESYETLFPEVPGVWVVDGTTEEKVEKILDAVRDHQETYLDIEQWYNRGGLSLGAFANLIGRNVIGVWANLTTRPNVGIKCYYGSREEQNYVLSLLDKTPMLIVDMIALLTLDHLQASDIVVNAYGKLGVVQSTVDLLQYALAERSGFESEGFSTLGKEGEQFVLEKVSPEMVQQGIEYFERLRDWVTDNCEVLPCHPALHIKWTRKKELEEILGKAFIDTILLASEPGRLLYSDDGRLRALAKHEHNIDGAWTQALLMHCFQNNLLEKERYHEMVIKLATAHYYHTSIDAEVLLESAKQANWAPSEPYTTLVQVLQGGASDENSALNVGTSFLFELWKSDVWKQQPEHRDALIQNLLATITTGRNFRRILARLKEQVKGRFVLLPFQEKEILSLIDTWEKTSIIFH